jgi:hypothetical protein
MGRDESCTYLNAQSSVNPIFSKDHLATVDSPARGHFPCDDDVSEPTVSIGTSASTDLVPMQIPTGPDWDYYWPPNLAPSSSRFGHVREQHRWEACAPSESAVLDFTFSPSTWQNLLDDQTIHGQHDIPLPRTGHTMDSLNFAFLAKFTSTTGFVKSFECGTLEERKRVVSSCATTELDEFSSGITGNLHANICSAENTSEGSHAVVDSAMHIWGFIMPEKTPRSSARTQRQQQAQVKPLYTEDWMQARSEALRTDSVASLKDTGTIQNFNFNLQSHHRLLSDPFYLITHEIISRIKEVISLKPRNSIVSLTWSSLLEELCLQFFSPPNLHKYLNLYWASWHPNWPVIHKPTFNPVAAHPVLVAAMALVGEICQVMSHLHHADRFRSLCVA